MSAIPDRLDARNQFMLELCRLNLLATSTLMPSLSRPKYRAVAAFAKAVAVFTQILGQSLFVPQFFLPFYRTVIQRVRIHSAPERWGVGASLCLCWGPLGT